MDFQEFDLDGLGSKERELYTPRTGDTEASANGNFGLFGVNVTYEVHLKNTRPDQHSLTPSIRARNNNPVDPKFAGAAEGAMQNPSHLAGKVPVIRYKLPTNGNPPSSVTLSGLKLTPYVPDMKLSIRITVAGGTNYQVSLTIFSMNATFVDD